jgi:hypothetical protein
MTQKAVLVFDSYAIYNFFSLLDKFIDTMKLKFKKINDELYKFESKFIDAKKTMMAKIQKKLFNQEIDEGFEVIFSVEELKNMLQVSKNDSKKTILTFSDKSDAIRIEKYLSNYKPTVEKNLILLDMDMDNVDMTHLNTIEYESYATFDNDHLDNFFKESGKVADVETITIDNSGLSFSELGQIGSFEWKLKERQLFKLNVGNGEEKGNYGLPLLSPLDKIRNVLEKGDPITLYLKEERPLKFDIKFKSLRIDMIVYLAPKLDKPEDDDEDF